MKNDKFVVSFQSSRYDYLTLQEELDFASQLKLPAFEIFFDGSLPSDLTLEDKYAIEKLQVAGMKFSVHAPIRDYLDFDEVDKSLCDFCNYLRPEFMTVHFDRLSENVLECFEKRLKSTKISIENVIPDRNILNDDNYLEFMPKIAKNHDILATIDIGHLFINGFAPIQYIQQILSDNIKIGCFHIHNNDGNCDSHNALPDGKIDYEKVLKFIFDNKIFARFVIEQWTDNEKSLKFFNKICELY